MAQESNEQPDGPGAGRQRSGRLAQYLLIAAIVLLIVIAAVSLR